MRLKFADAELKNVLKNLTILIDTREQANEHVIEFLEKRKYHTRLRSWTLGTMDVCYQPIVLKGNKGKFTLIEI